MAEIKPSRMIPIGDIAILPDIQIRIRVSEVKVQEYTAALKDDVDMDPIDVFVDKDERKILSDGMHRVLAYAAAKRDKIPAIVHDENPEDAISEALEFSMRRNCHHGLNMSNEDKRRAVALALSDKLLKRKGDRALGQLCGVSAGLVAKIRKNPDKATEPRKKPVKKTKDSEKSGASVSAQRESTPASGSTTKADKPEFREDSPTQDRYRMLKEWVESGQLDWPIVSNLFSNKKYVAVLQPKELDGMILFDKGKQVGTIAVKSLKFIRKGDKHFVEVERQSAAGKKTDA